ncbi:OVARIAN TUMOR DOMAIN-containing deubiquitinating enzyme 2 [Linum perenne]
MDGTVVRRVIPSDNSCLFNAVGYVMDHNKNKAPELRQDKKYSERVMLIYDGLHYDALAMSPFEEAPDEFDQTIFAIQKDRTIGLVEGMTLNLVRDQQRKRSYTDTANFTLRCGVCQIGVIGQKEAVEHAQATGHVNFQEYK